jgi:inhibitor of KinA sporulation pathway (predicted exonuclease)
MERGWRGPGEYREVVQIGAIIVDAETFVERASFGVLIKPVLNPTLSSYFEGLTRITNERLEREGVDLATGVTRFLAFAGKRPMHAYGRDDRIIAANAVLLAKPGIWPARREAFNLRDWLVEVGVPLAGIHSGELAKHVGATAQGIAHDAVTDSRSLAEAVRYLVKKGAPNPFLAQDLPVKR